MDKFDDIEVKRVHSSSVMAEAYGFGLPDYQKLLVSENFRILNTRNVPTRWIATLGTRNARISITTQYNSIFVIIEQIGR